MSKNLFRKGLVAASLVALGSTAIAGTPAFAADITTTSALGSATNFTGLYSQSFGLNTIASASGDLLYNISGVTAQDVETGDSQSVIESVKDVTAAYAGTGRTATDGSTYVATASSFTLAATNAAVGPTNYNHLTLKLTNATPATKTVKVIAWVDTIANGVKDSTEAASTTNVTFVKDSSVTATTVLTQPVLGATSHKATVTLDSGVNYAQVEGAVTVDFTKAVSAVVTNVGLATPAGYDSLKSAFIATATEPVVAGVYSAQAKLNGSASGAKASVAVATKTVATNGVGLATATSGENLMKSVNNFVVRAGTTSAITFTSQLTKSGTFGASDFVAVGAGVIAKVVVHSIALDASSVITAGGKTVSSIDTADIAFDVLTNANGQAVFTIANSGAVDLDQYTFTVSSEGEVAATQTVTYQKASYDFRGTLSDRSIVIGGSAVVATQIADQFGVVPSNGKFAVVISRNDTNSSRAAADEASFSFTVPVVNGLATATLVDNGAKAGNDVVTFKLYNVLPGGGIGLTTGSTKTFTLTYDTSANVNVTKVTAALDNNGIDRVASAPSASASPIALEPKDFAVTNTSIPNSSAPTYTTVATLTGNATNAAGAGIQGAAVTISAPGLAFSDGTQYTVGSITVVSGANGDYSVNVYSHTRGKQTITVSVGSATATVAILFGSATTSKITLDAPKVLQSGADLTVVVTFRDKWDNIVALNNNIWDLSGFYLFGSGAGYHSALDAGYYYYNLNPVSIDTLDAQFKATYTGPATASGTFTVTATFLGSIPLITASASTVISNLAAADAASKDATDKAKTVTVTPSVVSSQSGRAVDVSVKAVNAAGTAAAGRLVTFAANGAGSLTTTSAVTDANGVATVKLVAGASDNGDAVVTATVDGVKATAATITFGITDAQVDIVGKRVTAIASFTKGKTVAFYVDGVKKWSKLSASDADVVLNYNLKKGAHTVTVKISGGFTATEKFTVK